MSELRQDRTTGNWVIIAPKRRRRPHGWVTEDREAAAPPSFDPACPFCPGHESELPGIVAEAPADAAPGWSVRAVPNKFPALQAQTEVAAPDFGGHVTRPGYGFHEVVIESPRHNADLAALTIPERQSVVSMYRERSRALLGNRGIETVTLFRNHGSKGGASLRHPHAQIIALGFVPARLNTVIEAGLRHFKEQGRCATCAELEIEIQNNTRIVDGSEEFVVLVPFAAEHPFELSIVPRRHQASFTAVSDAELKAFSDLLGRSLRRLNAVLQYPPYNFVVDSAPKSYLSAPHFHWRLRIVPTLVSWGGFELGTGLPINPSSPEDDASVLRTVSVDQERSKPQD